ncbi:hypothetical protein PVMG_06293 [Plasmodium vivax Mauritania I]|uniref:Uncharacterized protein n=1 Tax=Plasmodium vivax Mauritania I TaxID=1035515 RepID=A0A0J9T3X1_PLAVI|nr:hypothetical protein PVMG_06293 [Plasmodium vivax Mauritania I]
MNMKYQAKCSLKNNRKTPLFYKGDENKYREKEKGAMNNTNEYKTVYEHLAKDTQVKDKSSKNKSKKKSFLFKPFSVIDSYFERILFNVFTSIDKFRNKKSSNILILGMIAFTKIYLVLLIPILFIVMACVIVLKAMNNDENINQYNYIYILFISIGIIMIIYLLIKVLKYSRSTKKNQLYSNNK